MAAVPFALWGMVWISIAPGNLDSLFDPDSPSAFIHALRAVSPFVAAFFASAFILFQICRGQPKGFEYFSPLGFAVVYGLVGLVATSLSPDGSVAFRWAVLYLSAPLVLWAIAWRTDALDKIYQLLNITWLCVILGAMALFAVGLIYLDLFDLVRDPRLVLECRSGNWYGFSSGGLRDTGVGRYAAIAALIAISVVLQRKWWPVSIPILVLSFVLLVFTGARGAMAGFAVASVLMVLLYGGKKSLAYGALGLLVLVPLFWGTGSHIVFYEKCILSGQTSLSTKASSVPPLPVASLNTGVPVSRTSVTPNATVPEGTGQLEPAKEFVKIPLPVASLNTGVPVPSTSTTPNATVPEGTGQLEPAKKVVKIPPTRVPDQPDFFTFTGRTSVWNESIDLVKESPLLGHGFHADRIILEAHVHNSVIHSLLQTGVIGAIPFLASVVFGWSLFIQIIRKIIELPVSQRHLVIQAGAVLAFLTVRSFPESTVAFFGVDWLILAPILLYLDLVHRSLKPQHNSENQPC